MTNKTKERPFALQAIAVTINDAVTMSGSSRSTLYAAMRNGTLPAKKNGRRTLIMVDDLRKWINSFPIYG